MFGSVGLFLSGSYWRHAFSGKRFLVNLFGALGFLWTLLKIGGYFYSDLDNFAKPRVWWFILVGVAWAIWEERPTRRVSYRLVGRDLSIAIEVGDLFAKREAALVIGSNRTFDTEISPRCISESSVQGQFTLKFYDTPEHLDADIAAALRGVPSQNVSKTFGKTQQYPIGTVAKVRARGRTAYLLALAALNQHGNARASIDDFREALVGLWQSVGQKGDLLELRLPVLGTGFSRLPLPRSEVICELLRSFIAANSEQRFCDGLTIVIQPKDFRKQDIDIVELERFLRHVCKYSEFRGRDIEGAGTGLPARADPEAGQRRRAEETREERLRYEELRALMPNLFQEMTKDLRGDASGTVREFVLVPNRNVAFDSSKQRFGYFETDHPNLRNLIDLLSAEGYLENVTVGNAPIFKMREHFVQMLKVPA